MDNKQFLPLNGKALVSVFTFQVTVAKVVGVFNEVSYNRGIFQRPFCCASYIQIGQILYM